ncbi:Purple acid phosphatase 2 [Acorus gramineus]|uniref:Purple acid phosphatase n=1 Tax=Acorus gramineus TaxID=55184 RepID=A0AAV9B1Y0_ACOGR|nr:Purple acid phosphatase 2 [Acorus gramineus]
MSSSSCMDSLSLLVVSAFLLFPTALFQLSNGGVTSSFIRKSEPSVDMPFDADVFQPPPGYNAPQQVRIMQGDHEGKAVIVSWVTPSEPGPRIVFYGMAEEKRRYKAHASSVTTYRFFDYSSGFIHHCLLKNLEHDTEYFYQIGIGESSRQFSFKTPPAVGPDVPYTFGIIGDLGQTYDSNETLSHYLANQRGQAVLFVGDLSYADDHPNHDNRRWDTFGRMIERSIAYQPWITTAGNHEIDFAPEIGEVAPFKPYKRRYRVPYKASQSTSPLWYSVKRASAYIIALSSYSAYGKYTPQYQWLQNELPKVNRTETPWLIVLVHSPLYNSYNYHYMEGETMRVQFESWFVEYKVDLVLSGHVHAYERSERVSNIAYNITNNDATPIPDPSAPVYITIGDGGNIEGLATNFTEPQPSYSAYREASFGHAILDIKNRTHAYYAWYRNHDGNAVLGDSVCFYNRYWGSNER